jgi:hypothetical protein
VNPEPGKGAVPDAALAERPVLEEVYRTVGFLRP